MISALTGTIHRVEEGRILLRVGPILYELLVPAADMTELHASLGEETTFHTIFYFEGDAARGNLTPRLIGFLRDDDKKFFDRFTTVKGIGPKRALRALAAPVGQIANAIEQKDTRFLIQLPEIGKRMAELIVAELSGKLGAFALATGAPGAPIRRRVDFEEDAISGLMALGERRAEAEALLERARQANPEIKSTDALLREMLRLRTARV